MSKDINNAFDNTLETENLSNLAIDLSEVSLDSFIQDEVLREIPVVTTLVSIRKSILNISDYLFLKKIIGFLKPLSSTTEMQRKTMIEKINNSKDYKIRVGENLIYLIDKAKDHFEAEIIGVLFCAYVQENITYYEFLDCVSIVSNLSAEHLEDFVLSGNDYIIDELISSRLYVARIEPINVSVEKQEDYKFLMDGGSEYSASIDGGDLYYEISPIGLVIRKQLFAVFKQ